jgi:hypothetical protein
VQVRVTLRRETLSGEAIGTEDGETYTGQEFVIEVPADPDVYLYALVEAEGYQDWETKFHITKPDALEELVKLQSLTTRQPDRQG